MNRFSLISRRSLLAGAVTGAASTLAPSDSLAADPVKRTGTAKFKFSLAAYSYRNLLSGPEPAMAMTDFVDDCARFGLDGTELTSYYFPTSVTEQYLYALRRHCFVQGLDVSGTAVGNDFGHPADSPRRGEQIQHVKTWVEHAAKLGAPVIRVFAGHQKKGVSATQAHRLMVSGLEECSEFAGNHGVYLALENHGGPTATADGLLKIVRDVQSPYLGINLDTGNFHTEDIYGDLARCAPYALNVQVKVVISGPDRKKEPTDFGRLASLLSDAAYRGYIVLEYEEAGDPRMECPRYIDRLRAAFKSDA